MKGTLPSQRRDVVFSSHHLNILISKEYAISEALFSVTIEYVCILSFKDIKEVYKNCNTT